MLLNAAIGPVFAPIAPADTMVIAFGIKIELWRCEIAFRS